jgi:hypothetical protein
MIESRQVNAESFWLTKMKLIEVSRKYGYVDFSKKLITREATRVSLEVEFPQPYPGNPWHLMAAFSRHVRNRKERTFIWTVSTCLDNF